MQPDAGEVCPSGGLDCVATPIDAITKANAGGVTTGTLGSFLLANPSNASAAALRAAAVGCTTCHQLSPCVPLDLIPTPMASLPLPCLSVPPKRCIVFSTGGGGERGGAGRAVSGDTKRRVQPLFLLSPAGARPAAAVLRRLRPRGKELDELQSRGDGAFRRPERSVRERLVPPLQHRRLQGRGWSRCRGRVHRGGDARPAEHRPARHAARAGGGGDRTGQADGDRAAEWCSPRAPQINMPGCSA